MESREPARLYCPALDGLRFVAAALVFIHHANVLPGDTLHRLRAAGYVGVDLFLVLSAFLLTRLVVAEAERFGSVRLPAYFARRALRIFPLYFGFVTAMLVVALVNQADGRKSFGYWASHLGFANNAVVAVQGFQGLPYTRQLWTISLEEQFYCVLPFAVVALARMSPRGRWAVIGLALGILAVARLACVLLRIPHPFVWAMPLRGDAFVLGVALGLMRFQLGPWRSAALVAVGTSMLVLMASKAVAGTSEEWRQLWSYPVIDGAAALLVAGSLGTGPIGRGLGWTPMRFLGRISFGLYVYHLLAIHLAELVAESYDLGGPWGQFTFSAAMTVAMATASYFLVERWFLVFKRRFERVPSRPA